MSGERFVVIGLARVRSQWFATVAAWANTGRVPVEFVKCVSAAEVRARVDAGRGASALLIEAGVPGLDRDLIDVARTAGIATIVVGAGSSVGVGDNGAAATLPDPFDESSLIETLRRCAVPMSITSPGDMIGLDPGDGRAHNGMGGGAAPGALVVVTGTNGSGSSTIAMAIAQGLAQGRAHGRSQGRAHDQKRTGDLESSGRDVLLADLVRGGDLAMYHHARDVVPGFQEVVEAFRSTTPDSSTIGSLLFADEQRGYALLLGLRRRRDWVALRPRAVEAALLGLRRTVGVVVADVDPELDGEAQTGSMDLEERNATSRLAVRDASVVVTTADASLKGLHQLLQLHRELDEFGVDPNTLITVINRAPRSPRQRAELTRTLATLGASGSSINPVFLTERRGLETVHSLGSALPQALVRPITTAVTSVLDRSSGAWNASDERRQPTAPSNIETASAVTTAAVSPR